MSIFDNLVRDASNGNLLSQIAAGAFGTSYQKDYAHASKLMRPDGLALAPKQKFLFHTFFTINPNVPHPSPGDKGLPGALVKSIQLPSFTLDTEEYVQYNRKRLVHNRIKYEPVTIKFHDDGNSIITQLWQYYYNYYFADAQYEYLDGPVTGSTKTDYNGRDIYNPTRSNQAKGWGKTVANGQNNGTKLAFFENIKIFGFNRGKFTSYTLINPVITAWRPSEYDYSAGDGVMEHEVTVQYEAVKYGGGLIGQGNIDGFAEASRYDTEPGALGPGSTKSIDGPGGLGGAYESIASDLANGNILGALGTAGTAATTFGSIENVANVATEFATGKVTDLGLGAITSGVRSLNFSSSAESKTGNTQSTSPKSENDT